MSESRVKLTDVEIAIICRALDAAVRELVRMDYLGALTEYTSATSGKWSEIDERATEKNKAIALGVLAKLTGDSWGVATMDGGIEATRTTRAKAVEYLPFATPYHREQSGALWICTSEEGNSYTVGRIRELLKAGFEFACVVDEVPNDA